MGPASPAAQSQEEEGLTQSAAPHSGAWRPAAPWTGTGTCRQRANSGPGAGAGTGQKRVERLGHLPLRELGRSHLLPRGIHMAHHKVFGDLLHVLKVEEGVEAQLVCKDTPLRGRK